MSLTRVHTMSNRPPSRHRRPARAAMATMALVAGTALSGCGLTDQGIRPGTAAEVGDTTISLDEVDEAGGTLCDLNGALVEKGQAPPVSRGWAQDRALVLLVLQEIGDRLGEEHDVTPSDQFQGTRDEIEANLSELDIDADVVEPGVELLAHDRYFFDVVQQLGAPDGGQGPGDNGEAVYNAGIKVVQEWVDEHGLEVNPRFQDIEIVGGQDVLTQERDDLSVAASDFAKSAVEYSTAREPDPSYAESLPESQRCG